MQYISRDHPIVSILSSYFSTMSKTVWWYILHDSFMINVSCVKTMYKSIYTIIEKRIIENIWQFLHYITKNVHMCAVILFCAWCDNRTKFSVAGNNMILAILSNVWHSYDCCRIFSILRPIRVARLTHDCLTTYRAGWDSWTGKHRAVSR